MREPYRVAVWGPGLMGGCAIREIIRLPEMELVGVLAYSESKNGVDAGTLAGVDPVGVHATTNVEEFLALKPEVILHTARDYGDFASYDDIVKILESGINVITVLSYQYPQHRGKEFAEPLQQAAVRGGATLHGGGVDPGFLFEKLAATMTGISNSIECIRLEEYFNCEQMDANFLPVFGFGSTLDSIDSASVAPKIAANYLEMGMNCLADHLGAPIKRIEQTSHHVVTETGTRIPGFEIEPGTVGMVSFQWIGYTETDQPLYQIHVNWYLNETMQPEAAKGTTDFWIMSVEGVPSTRMGLEMKGSFAKDLTLSDVNPGPAAFLATIVPCIQAIPAVIDAEPGIHLVDMPTVHWKPDLRL